MDKRDKIGVIGENGAGKTTLIKLITADILPDSGQITFAKNTNVGYLQQNSLLNEEFTVYKQMQSVYEDGLNALSAIKEVNKQLADNPDDKQLLQRHSELTAITDACDIYNIDTHIKKVLNGMNFSNEDYDKSVSVLSGGEYTRLCLASLLLQKPDILLLDEPTNHLDFSSMQWLENYLQNYEGAVIVISHDRYFLDVVCNRVFEIENNEMYIFKGNYSAYTVQKQEMVEKAQKQYEADIEKQEKLKDYIARNIVRASTTKMAQSRRKQLEKMQITNVPGLGKTELKFSFEFNTVPYKDVLTAKNLTVEIAQKLLVKNLDIDVKRGECLVIAGPNGSGKSTLLKVLCGKFKQVSGSVKIGKDSKISVYEQQQHRSGDTVLSTLWNKWPKFTQLEARSHLAKLNFRGEDVFKPCSALSGGELARLRFSEMLLENANLLFMDEPTNHLDIYLRESLNAALCAYEGTLIVVTHDRYLMKSLDCKILYIDGDNTTYYDSYEQLMKYKSEQNVSVKPKQEVRQEDSAKYGKEQRRKKAELRATVKQCEAEMQKLEDDIANLEGELNTPQVAKDHVKLAQICSELDEKRAKNDKLFSEWHIAIEQLEQVDT